MLRFCKRKSSIVTSGTCRSSSPRRASRRSRGRAAGSTTIRAPAWLVIDGVKAPDAHGAMPAAVAAQWRDREMVVSLFRASARQTHAQRDYSYRRAQAAYIVAEIYSGRIAAGKPNSCDLGAGLPLPIATRNYNPLASYSDR